MKYRVHVFISYCICQTPKGKRTRAQGSLSFSRVAKAAAAVVAEVILQGASSQDRRAPGSHLAAQGLTRAHKNKEGTRDVHLSTSS